MSSRPAIWTSVLMAGCSYGEEPLHWSEKMSPSGACWEVNLADGLDETSTDELHNLFACLNRTGNLAALTPVDAVMDTPSRTGEPLGIHAARLNNALPTSGYDLLGLVGKALQVVDRYHDDAGLVLESTVELIYGTPYSSIGSDFSLGTEAALQGGVLLPLMQTARPAATSLLDAGSAAQEETLTWLDSDLLEAATCTMAGVIYTEDEALKPVGEQLMGNLAQAWRLSNVAGNDLWSDASGSSIRDLFTALRLGTDESSIRRAQPILAELLGDDAVQRHTEQALLEAASAGHLTHLPTQLKYLADVSSGGIPLSSGTSGSVSALQAGVRLIHNGNREVDCRVDLPLVPDLEFSLGNLSVSILRRMATMNETAAVDSVDLLGDVLSFGLTETVLDAVVASGVCPVFSDQMVEDLEVLERLNDPAVGNLVAVMHGLLDAVYREGQHDRLTEAVDLISMFYTDGLIPPAEEALRDLASSRLAQDLSVIIQTVIDPSSLNVDACDSGADPLDFAMLWQAASSASGTAAEDSTLGFVVGQAVNNEAFWHMIANGAHLADQPEARIHQLPEVVVNVLLDDSNGVGLDAIRQTVRNEKLWNSALALAESAPLTEAISAPSTEVEGPLPFLARLIRSETVTVMLQTLELLLDSLSDD